MSIDLERLIISLEVRDAQILKQMTKLNAQAAKSARGIEAEFARANKSLAAFGKDAFADTFEELTTRSLKLLAPIEAVTLGIEKTQEALKKFNEIGEAAKRSGLSTDFYQTLGFAAKESGVDQETLNTALDVFAKNTGLAAAGTGPLYAGLKALNPELLKNILAAKDQDQRLRLVADAMAKADSATKRLALSSAIFGRSGAVVAEVFKDGSASLSEFTRRGRELGVIIDHDMIEKSAELQKQINVLSFVIDTNLNASLISLAPLLEHGAEALANVSKELRDLVDQPNLEHLVKLLDFHVLFGANADAAKAFFTQVAVGADKAAGNIAELAKNGGASDQSKEAVIEISHLFTQVYKGVSALKITPEQLAMIEALSKNLDDTAFSADAAKKAAAEIGASNPNLELFPKRLNPLIDKLHEFTDAAKGAGEAVKNISVPEDPRRFDASGADLSKFLSTGEDEAGKSDFDKQVDAKAKALIEASGKIVDGATQVAHAMTEAAAKAQATRDVLAENAAKSLDTSISSYVNHVIGAESGGKRDAKNPLSSATGIGQFISSTWLKLFKENFPDRAKGMTDAAILLLRNNEDDSKALIEAYARQNAAILQKAGVSVNEAALQLAHFLGPGGAIKVLQAAPGTPIKGLLSDAQIKANPTILGGNATVDTVRGYAEQRAGMSTPNAQMAGAREDFTKRTAEQKAYIDGLIAETGLRAKLNPLVNDYGQALSTLQVGQQLLTEAQKEGIESGAELKDVQQLLYGDLSKLSPAAREQALAMRALAMDTGSAEAASNKLDASQAHLQQNLQASAEFGKDIFGGLIRDLRDGKSGAEALSNALQKVGDKLLDMGLNLLFDGPVAGSGGGILGGLFSFLFAKDGGFIKLAGGGPVRGPGGPRGDKIPAMLSDGEHVTRAAMAKKYGPLLEAINADRLPRLADGGYALPRVPSLPPISSVRGKSGEQNVHVTVGISADKNGNLTPFVESVTRRTAAPMVQAGMKQANASVLPTVARYQAQVAGSDYRT